MERLPTHSFRCNSDHLSESNLSIILRFFNL